MRTTLDIDEDVLQAAKEIARREKKTAGQVVSMLARSAGRPRAARRAWLPALCLARRHRNQRGDRFVARELRVLMRSPLDVYLLALAVRREGRLVTSDRAIAVSAIRGPGEAELFALDIESVLGKMRPDAVAWIDHRHRCVDPDR
jgi:predicted nucleic acid-binding protein